MAKKKTKRNRSLPQNVTPVETAAAVADPKVAKGDEPALAEPISAEGLLEILDLSKGATSIELKLSVPASSHRATVEGIGFDPVEAQPRQAFFFDTPDLALNRAGVVVRARRTQGGTGDTVVKLRPVVPSSIDEELRRSESFKTEVDVMPGGFVCSGSFKGVCTGAEVLDVSSGAMPLSKIFSKAQRAFYDEHAPAGITMDQLVLLGPTFLLKAKHRPTDFDRKIIIEMWLYPDGSRIMEISTKCLPKETFQFAVEFKSYLARHGIKLGADQSSKTKTSLEFFSARLGEDGLAG